MQHCIETLEALVNTPSPSGFTAEAEAFVMRHLRASGYEPWQSNKGTVYARLNEGEGDGILLSAHVDTLGFMVRSIKSNGRLRVTTVGGFPLQYAEQECVHVRTRDGQSFEGTLRLNEPAVHASREVGKAERTDETMEIVLDQRVGSQEDTEKLGIQAGDFVSLEPRFRRSGDGFIKSRHLDDKASCAILLELARRFRDGECTCKRPVYLMFTNYEEVGHGASAAHPEGITDMIAVDMGVVGDDLTTDETKVSICAKDSTGPYSYGLTDALVKTAREKELDFAVDIYPYYGSDTNAALVAGYDYRHALIGPGVAASHGYERVHIDGLTQTLRLLEAFLNSR